MATPEGLWNLHTISNTKPSVIECFLAKTANNHYFHLACTLTGTEQSQISRMVLEIEPNT